MTAARLLSWSAWTLFLQLGTALASAAFLVISARALGPEGRGEIAQVTVSVSLMTALGLAGVQSACLYYAAKGTHPAVVVRRTASIICVSTVIGMVALLPISFDEADSPLVLGLAVLIGLGGSYASTLLQWSLLGVGEFRVASIARLAANVALVSATGALFATGALTVTAAVAAWSGMWVALAALLWFVARPRLRHLTAARANGVRRFAIEAWPTSVGHSLASRVDLWLVGLLSSTEVVGTYSVALAASEFLILPAQAVASAMQSAAANEGHGFQRGAALKATLLTALLALLALPSFYWGVPVLLGDSFRDAWPAFAVLCVAALPLTVGRLGSAYLTGAGQPAAASRIALASTIGVAGASLILIPPYGGSGAAIATLVGALGGGATAICEIRERSGQ